MPVRPPASRIEQFRMGHVRGLFLSQPLYTFLSVAARYVPAPPGDPIPRSLRDTFTPARI